MEILVGFLAGVALLVAYAVYKSVFLVGHAHGRFGTQRPLDCLKLITMQVLLRSLPVSEEVWDQGAATNSLPGQLQGQSEDGKSAVNVS